MGSCISSSSSSSSGTRRHSSAAADVILSNGELRQLFVPVKASQVLVMFSGSAAASFFLCNSDRLYFDEHIPAMGAEEELEAGQIYFVLPAGRLHHRLAASDMAALAVTASAALKNTRIRAKPSRISPVTGLGSESTTIVTSRSTSNNNSSSAEKMKLQRYSSSSRRVKMAGVRTFRLFFVYVDGT
ncbi:hypothetical protein DM860_003828 [Cuscuta australis]|uniref:Uncharacterized protein n=1 Tax=Cuscuta australis TaxID=267555 RepID=A0A328DL92_9ASTE|nr:hypothetical protein DM860_003828 [Cuscuta australis]